MVRAVALLALVACAADPAGSVTITGSVRPAAAVDVVFRSGAREEVAKTSADGKYRIVVPAGTYRVAVRSDAWMTVGDRDLPRLPGLPSAAAAGAPDVSAMPELVVTHDAEDVDIAIVRSGIVTGTVLDVDARAISGAVVSAHGAALPRAVPRPAFGTDVAVSRADGSFELRLPDGEYQLAASHPAFADSVDVGRVDVRGGTRHVSLTLVKGCVVSGRVLAADGKPAGEGAIEKRFGTTDLEFAPNGRVEPDGTFRWTTLDEREVVLRVWPWHSAPSASKAFACRDGARFTTTFTLPDHPPDMSGELVDRAGNPQPFVHLDVQPLDPGGIAQQERTDANGRWAVFAMPPGRYAISARAPGGVVSTVVSSPSTNTQLELSGTGRLAGTTTNLASGSFTLVLGTCFDRDIRRLAPSTRLVIVRGGQFVVDGVPACDLQLQASWRDQAATARATVPPGGVARVQLDLGPPRDKLVLGRVRDADGKPASRAHVTARYRQRVTSAITDEDGRFTIETNAGATLDVERDGARGTADVSLANLARERVDVVLSRR